MAQKRKRPQAPLVKPQFFKIMLPCFFRRLRIPEGFNKYIAGEMPKTATILSPLGRPWMVEVDSDDRFFYFGEGWHEFCHAHDLDLGYLLLFTYEGEMVFTATIFDRTTCMKEYSPAGEGNKVDGCSCCIDAVKKPPGRPIPQEALRERSLTEILGSTDSQNRNPKVASRREGSQFEIIMSSCNPCEEPSLLLPQQIVNCLGGENGRLATIFSATGEVWHIKVHEDGKGFHFTTGWQKFAEAHNLRLGDSLVFKNIGNLFFDVTVLNNSPSEGAEELPMPLSGKVVSKATESTITQDGSVKMEESVKHDCCEEPPDIVKRSTRILRFKVLVNLSTPYRRCALAIPPKFAASNGLSRFKQLLLRDPNRRLWPLTVSHRRKYPCRLTGCAGWRGFCIGNNVRDGDICLFQLKKKNELHVKIHRKKHQKAIKVSRGLEKLPVPSLSREVPAKATEPPIGQNGLVMRRKFEAHKRNRRSPNIVDRSARILHFEAVIDFSLPYRRYTFGIPARFIASNDLSHVKELLLRDPHGQLWPLRISHNGQRRRTTAYAGWHDFCVGNNLQDGDVCMFQLKAKVVLHVQISRRIHQKSVKDTVSGDTSMKSERLLSRHSAAGLRRSERYHQVLQFTCTIPKSCYRSYHLNIPSSFLSSVDLSCTGQITLVDANARLWPVKIYHHNSRKQYRVIIGSGWKAFCIANAVKAGDQCVFELAPRAKNSCLFHVSVIKREAVLGRRPRVRGN